MAASGVNKKRCSPCGRVFTAGCVVTERPKTGGRVGGAGPVGKERIRTDGSVMVAGCIGEECLSTYCRVAAAGCEAEESIIALGGVEAGIASVGWWLNGPRCGREREAGKRDEKC